MAQAMDWDRLREKVLRRYQGMCDCFLLVVDRDGDAGRRAGLDRLEGLAREALPDGRVFLAENAWQEVEVWVLAGHDLPADWSWKDVRAEPHSEERYFQPFAEMRGQGDGPGGGRRRLGQEAAQRYGRIRQLCPEDIAALESRLGTALSSRPGPTCATIEGQREPV